MSRKVPKTALAEQTLDLAAHPLVGVCLKAHASRLQRGAQEAGHLAVLLVQLGFQVL